MSHVLRITSAIVILASIFAMAASFVAWRRPSLVMESSYKEVYDASQDPKLPAKFGLPMVDVLGRSIPSGPGLLVLCGQCASCTLKTFNANAVGKRL